MYDLKFKIKKVKTVAMQRAEKRLGNKRLFDIYTNKEFTGKNVYITPDGDFQTQKGKKLAICPGRCARHPFN